MKHVAIVVLLVSAATAQIGCGRKVPPATAANTPAPPAVTKAPPAPAPPATQAAPAPSPSLSEEELFAQKTVAQLNTERPLGTVFFDYDQYVIRDDARAVLQRNAEWLRRWSSTRITIEGHCDERGSAEYNLALGDRRATVVKDYLVSLGVAPERLTVVSRGKESLYCTDSGEDCWQQNRRGQPIIMAK